MTTASLPLLATIADAHQQRILWAHYYFALFGLLTLVGGVMGYVKAKSTASLVAGGVSGLLLIFGAFLIFHHYERGGGALLLLISLALLGRFTPALLRGKLNPAAYVAPLSLLGAILAILLLFAAVR